MVDDSKKKMFNYVIVYQLDRFARNRYDSATYKAKLKKNSVRVLSARENITDDASGVLVEGMLESMVEYFSKELSQKVTRGMKESIYKGNWTGGQVAYGYDVVDKKYVINEIESNVVKRVFKEVLQNKRLNDIVKELNKQGFRNKKGNEFNTSFLSRLVKNKKYIGEISAKYGSVAPIPSIINEYTFKRVQDKLSPHKRKPAQEKAVERYYLSGKTHCAICNSPITADSGTNNIGVTYRYYKCSNRKRNRHACNKSMIGKNNLEDLIIQKTIDDIFMDASLINEISENVAKTFNEQIKENLKVRSLEIQLQEINKKIANIMHAIESGIITPTTKESLMNYKSLKIDVDKKLSSAKNKSIKSITKDDVNKFINSFAGLDYTKSDNRERLLEIFIREVYLYDDYALVAYNGTNDTRELDFGNKKTEIEAMFEFGSYGAP